MDTIGQRAVPYESPYAMQQTDFGTGLASWQSYFSQSKEVLHFAPANGLPAATYHYFIEQLLADHSVTTLDNRGAWPNAGKPHGHVNWRNHVSDFLAFAEHNYDQPIHYVGHSLGATIGLMAAIQKPNLFKSLVMIDPGTVPRLGGAIYMKVAPNWLKDRLPLIKSTQARRDVWPDRESFIAYIAKRSTYRGFTRRALYDYAQGGLEESADGLKLRFSPLWEAHNFKSTAYVWPYLKSVKVPTLLLRGEHSNLFSQQRYDQLVSRFNNCDTSVLQVQQLNGLGHLAPQEGPEQTAEAIKHWLEASR
ncbi:alpha/beta hydrolase [Pseudomonadales bacterium]|jgi:pimeloyl-ACP methyl ester carboxylesterase|nr:alpha/beta hydrolase [Pseudomonadales bacterium]MDB4450775.1 alpha/beta hydrolase [Pseudomonadales bacterium]